MTTHDPVMTALLSEMGREISRDVGPDVAFALFIEWPDGRPMSYLSNARRHDVFGALREWLAHMGPGSRATAGSSPTALQRKAAELGSGMVEEDIDVLLFLFEAKDPVADRGSEGAWWSSIPWQRRLIEAFVATDKEVS